MIPFISIISFLILFSFFINFNFNINVIFIIFIIILFIILFTKKKKLLYYLILLFLFFIYHHYQLNNFFYRHSIITKGRQFTGIILQKKLLDKKYIYLVNLNSFYILKKKEIINANISIISNKNINIGDFISIPFIFFLQKYNDLSELKKKPINFISHASGIATNIKILNNNQFEKVYNIIHYLNQLKENFLKSIKSLFMINDNFFFETIFLGIPSNNCPYRNLFLIWGISHYLARSGLHIQIAINILISFFLFLGFSYFTSIIIQLLFLFIFYFFTFPSISFFRAFIMFFLFVICKLLRLPTTSIHTISITIIITFLFYPFSFLQLSTQLTFFTTFILALINYIKKIYKK